MATVNEEIKGTEETTVLTGKEAEKLLLLGQEAAVLALDLANHRDGIESGSKTLFEKFKDVFPMNHNYGSGKADVTGFVQRIYDIFPPEQKSANPKKPGQYFKWTVAEAHHGNRAARGLKALERWITANIATLYATYEPEVDETTGEVKKDEKGEPVLVPRPMFKSAVGEAEKNLKKVTSAFTLLEKSDLLTKEEKEELSPIFKRISDRILPNLKAEKEARKASLTALKEAETGEEKPEAEKVVNE